MPCTDKFALLAGVVNPAVVPSNGGAVFNGITQYSLLSEPNADLFAALMNMRVELAFKVLPERTAVLIVIVVPLPFTAVTVAGSEITGSAVQPNPAN